jgi:hypothetical protein
VVVKQQDFGAKFYLVEAGEQHHSSHHLDLLAALKQQGFRASVYLVPEQG